MSAESTPVTNAHFEYIAARTRGDDAFLLALKRAALERGIPGIWISPEQASLLRILLGLTGARHVVEVGTLAGYAAISMARALPADGKVTTVELDEDYAAFAREQIAASDVAGRVEVLVGDGRDVLPTLPEASADAMFLDADKSGYATYLEDAWRILRPNGMLLVDNAFAFGELLSEAPSDPETGAVRAFNEVLARDDRFESCIVPIGDGCWVGRRK